MRENIAEKRILYSLKGSNIRKKLLICIGAPYVIDSNKVNFSVGDSSRIGKLKD